MKKHISLFLTFILMACLSAGAQENQAELKSKVNEIKKSPDYIYAETTRETAEEAKSAAEEQLYNNINIWVAHEKDLRGAKHVDALVGIFVPSASEFVCDFEGLFSVFAFDSHDRVVPVNHRNVDVGVSACLEISACGASENGQDFFAALIVIVSEDRTSDYGERRV